ncbi:MAG TPA: tRNA 2-thiouridine(34) synthase MnmA [Acidimicrobiales bacterium]|nr:tRNA 2-thiouridine(34) synthase MnmA [Acidimicrobiales bacterium]
MRVLVAMSGGVDSSVAAALLVDAGHEVTGATMKLWGGAGDSGCCSVADVEDARRVAQQLGIAHHVFNFTDDFERDVVGPYVGEHARGRTPNPCIECNRHLKFDRFLRRAEQLGFDAIATGHHARVARTGEGRWELRRGVDLAKDQSYVLSMLDQAALARTMLPVGELTKGEVRRIAASRSLRTADKPDSQDVCFVLGTKGGREAFLGARIPLRPGTLVDRSGRRVGEVDAVELVTVGQRRGLGGGGGPRLYALDVDTSAARVVVGADADLLDAAVGVSRLTWVDEPLAPPAPVLLQVSAHGEPHEATLVGPSTFAWSVPRRRVAPGQTVAVYVGERVVGAGIAESNAALNRSAAPSPL